MRLDQVIRSETGDLSRYEYLVFGSIHQCQRCSQGLYKPVGQRGRIRRSGKVRVTVTVSGRGRDLLVATANSGRGVPDESKELNSGRFEREQEEESGEGPGIYHENANPATQWANPGRRSGSGRPEEGVTFRLTLQKNDCADGEIQDPGGLTV